MFGREVLRRLGLKVWTGEKLLQAATDLIVIVIIFCAAVLLYQLVSRVLRRFERRQGKHTTGRRKTVIPLIRNILRYVIGFTALVLILHQLGINYTALLAGAGVVGLAVGFGAQTLVRDVISGFFILFEGLIEVGDFIEIGDQSGTVEQVGLRTTQFRSFRGVLYSIPNGELTRFGNFNRGFSRAAVEISVAYRHNSEEVMALIQEVANDWAKEHQDIVLEKPTVNGIIAFGASGINLLLTVKVKPQTHWQAERELRVALKAALDEAGIEIPVSKHDVRLIAQALPKA